MNFHWNGRAVLALPGDSIAMALWRAGVTTLGSSRKRHRPLGASNLYLQGSLVTVNGRPHVRAHNTLVVEGMQVWQQNTWPNPNFNVLRLLQLIPAQWTRGGFERPRALPGGTRRFQAWERLLMFLAGEVTLSPHAPHENTSLAGERWDGDVVVVGGGLEGRRAANAAAAKGERICLICRSAEPGAFASDLGVALPTLDSRVKCLLRHEAVGIYREGSVTIASPIDADQAASVLVAKRLVLAIGQRSVLPVLPGHDLPGVLDARLALSWAPGLGQSLGRTVVVGTRGTDLVARALQARGVQVVAVSQADALRRVLGRKRVEAVDLRGDIQPCACLVHAGPWMTEPALPFQAGAVGSLRLAAGKLPGTVSIVGSALYSDEQVPLAPLASLSESAVCPCMDVSVGELMAHLERGQTHVEVLKRSTSCGMGPCQGFPCWEHLRAVVKEATGHEVVDRPTYRPPRAGLTVAQAAALDGLLEHQ